ncbi:uncharacterized protein E0L32_006253 [Thyridium curvatum]|uniref:General transcription and DNA repair factor IIH subunit TFB5 n=1 Tax=Thyridium curvatum TaxID=1093900 RepID=A0A507B9K5_9PEZI|nr:uncharacterized protein E0L32_006253 [Thyridium curvatum]TPX13280.1 hypothetical protein E0L32_006253 [Thyridium curvatum]
MVTAVRGTLIQVDPPIKAIIVKIDAEENHAFIIEDLDDNTLFVKESALPRLKQLLEQGSVPISGAPGPGPSPGPPTLWEVKTISQAQAPDEVPNEAPDEALDEASEQALNEELGEAIDLMADDLLDDIHGLMDSIAEKMATMDDMADQVPDWLLDDQVWKPLQFVKRRLEDIKRTLGIMP